VAIAVDDHSRTERMLHKGAVLLGPVAIRVPEKLPEERIVEERELLWSMHSPRRTNRYDSGSDSIDNVSVGLLRGSDDRSARRFLRAGRRGISRPGCENRNCYSHQCDSQTRDGHGLEVFPHGASPVC
jgi:hypothetical protein